MKNLFKTTAIIIIFITTIFCVSLCAKSAEKPKKNDIPEKITISKIKLLNFLSKSPKEMMKTTNISAYRKNKKMAGIKFIKLENNSPLLEMFNLKLKDVILSVNGENLDSREKIFAVLQSVSSLNEMDIVLLRDKKKYNIKIILEEKSKSKKGE